MDGKSLGLLDKSKAGPKGKDDFAVAFHTHSLLMYNTDTHTAHPYTLLSFRLFIFFLRFKGTVQARWIWLI
jgi:hypothetical protein